MVKVQPNGSNKNEATVLPRLYCSKYKSYVLLEGLTNFGLELIDFLVTRGARKFIITTTQKDLSGYQNLCVKSLKSYGVLIIIHKEFDPIKKNIVALFENASKGDTIDAVFDLYRFSKSIEKISEDTLNSVTKIVDETSRSLCQDLRFFIVYSSMKKNRENSKKITLSENILESKNNIVEKIIKQRKKNGLSGLFVITDFTENDNDFGVVSMPPKKYLEKLDEIIGIKENTVEIYVIDTFKEVCKFFINNFFLSVTIF